MGPSTARRRTPDRQRRARFSYAGGSEAMIKLTSSRSSGTSTTSSPTRRFTRAAASSAPLGVRRSSAIADDGANLLDLAVRRALQGAWAALRALAAELKRIEAKHAEATAAAATRHGHHAVGLAFCSTARRRTTTCRRLRGDVAFRKRQSRQSPPVELSTMAADHGGGSSRRSIVELLQKPTRADGATLRRLARYRAQPDRRRPRARPRRKSQLPLQASPVHPREAGFHLVCAAAGGVVRAASAKFFRAGAVGRVLLPGVSLAPAARS